MKDIKQIIVVRTRYPDGNGGVKGIRKGKLISQACHASIAFMVNPYLNDGEPTKEAIEWYQNRQTKVCLQIHSEEELLNLHQEALSAGLESNVITDAGLTEFNGVPTITCVAIGPNDSEEIDKITGHLKLY